MAEFIKFVGRHMGAAFVAAFGAALTVHGLLSETYSIYTLGLSPSVVSAVGALIFMGAMVIVLFQWEQRIPLAAPLTQSNERNADLRKHDQRSAEAARLLTIAERDSKAMEGRVLLIEAPDLYARAQFDAPEPYFDLQITIANGSVFPLTVSGKVDGALHCRGHAFRDVPIVMNKGALVEHGNWGDVNLRQHLSKDAAREIATLVRSGQHEQIVVGFLGVWFDYANVRGEQKSVRRGCGNRLYRFIPQEMGNP